jgi:hypothetical protein
MSSQIAVAFLLESREKAAMGFIDDLSCHY